MKFEEAMEKLKRITEQLEEGNISLDEALERFEEGMKLIGFCEKELGEAEKKIQVLMKEKDHLKLKEWREEKIEDQTREDRTEEKDKNQLEEDSDFLFKE